MKSNKNIYFLMILFLVMFSFKTIVLADAVQCEAWGRTLDDLNNLFNFCKIIIPLLVVGLSIFDFIKAVAGKDEKDLKTAFNKLLKRLALAVVFFFLPMLLQLLLDLFATNSNVCVGLE